MKKEITMHELAEIEKHLALQEQAKEIFKEVENKLVFDEYQEEEYKQIKERFIGEVRKNE